MTKIRNLLISYRARRARQLQNSDSVSFEAFCNDRTEDYNNLTKESSLSNVYNTSPKHNKGNEYVSFQRTRSFFKRPDITTIIIFSFILTAILFVPILVLLEAFGVIHVVVGGEQDIGHIYHAIKEKEHYSPSSKIRQELDNFKTQKVLSPITDFRNLPKYKDLPPPPKPDYDQCKVIKDKEKLDCYPENGANQEKCEERGCCWVPRKFRSKKKNAMKSQANLDVPYCFYPENYQSYKYVNVTEQAFGLVAFLKRTFKSPYPNDVETIKMVVKYETENRLHIKFTDPSHYRYEPGFPELPMVDKAATNLSYNLVIDPLKTGFKILRKSDFTPVFDTSELGNMIFADQFLQLSARLPSSYIYGLGEHQTNLMLNTNWQRFTMFNHDSPPMENRNLYGSHPMYMMMEKSGNANGFLLLNSNAMDVILQPAPIITFRPIGGVLDMYYFFGPTPAEVVNQYTDLVGRPFMPPYWGLGFHLCRFGYKTLNQTRAVMQRNIDAGIPIDTQWNDLDYMNSSNDFTYDKVNFKGLPEFVKELHEKGMHYIPLIDAGVSGSEPNGTYLPYDKGIEMDIFIKNSTGMPFVGKVWNKATTLWPDFTNPKTIDYWTLMLQTLHNAIQFDGAWIDMNEPSNFLSGSFDGCPKSSLENPPYLPSIDGDQLNYKTLCMTAQHYAGFHYNVHNIYGFTEAIVTSFALAEIRGKRPMVISRSTFAGHGHYAGHWSGDVYSKWYDMKMSIPQLLQYSMFGVPLMGADICGFNGNTTATLCNRWMQLGSFYPFSRNHNTDDGIDQDPVALGSTVIASSKKALSIRYKMLPYLYTLFWAAHINGETVARPLFFEFPKDNNTYAIDEQFLWGPAFLIVPVLEESSLQVSAYLPNGIWYDYYTKSFIRSKGERFNFSAPLDTIPLLIRGGYIIPQQSAKLTTTESRKTKIELLVATDETGQAQGQLYWDDGDSLNTVEEQKYSLLQFNLKPNELRIEPVFWGPETPPNLGLVTILGVTSPVAEVYINKVSQAFRYDTIHKYLLIDNLDTSFKSPIVIDWK